MERQQAVAVGRGAVRPLAILNALLSALTLVRAHTLHASGNEGVLLLIQPGVAEAMRTSGLFPEREIRPLAE
jgi:hypothetical protein